MVVLTKVVYRADPDDVIDADLREVGRPRHEVVVMEAAGKIVVDLDVPRLVDDLAREVGEVLRDLGGREGRVGAPGTQDKGLFILVEVLLVEVLVVEVLVLEVLVLEVLVVEVLLVMEAAGKMVVDLDVPRLVDDLAREVGEVLRDLGGREGRVGAPGTQDKGLFILVEVLVVEVLVVEVLVVEVLVVEVLVVEVLLVEDVSSPPGVDCDLRMAGGSLLYQGTAYRPRSPMSESARQSKSTEEKHVKRRKKHRRSGDANGPAQPSASRMFPPLAIWHPSPKDYELAEKLGLLPPNAASLQGCLKEGPFESIIEFEAPLAEMVKAVFEWEIVSDKVCTIWGSQLLGERMGLVSPRVFSEKLAQEHLKRFLPLLRRLYRDHPGTDDYVPSYINEIDQSLRWMCTNLQDVLPVLPRYEREWRSEVRALRTMLDRLLQEAERQK